MYQLPSFFLLQMLKIELFGIHYIILPVNDGSGVVDFCRLLDKGLFTEKKDMISFNSYFACRALVVLVSLQSLDVFGPKIFFLI